MIRLFRESDAFQCSKIMIKCIDKNLTGLSDKNRNFMIEKSQPINLIKKSKIVEFFVYEKEGKIIGTGVLDKDEIRTMFIDPKYQRKGIGSEILNFLINKAKLNGFKRVWLKSSPEAEEFYKKNNFVKLKVRKEFDFITVEMEKKL